MSYSLEEIERKRILALQRKQQGQEKNSAFSPRNVSLPSNSRHILNDNKSTNVVKSFERGASKYGGFGSKLGHNSFKSNGKFNKQKDRFNPMSTQKFFGQNSRVTGKCYMITDERFKLETSSYLPALIQSIKSIPSRSYGNITKLYSFVNCYVIVT